MVNRFLHFGLFPSYQLCKSFLSEFEYIRQNIIQHRWAQVSWRQKFNYAKQQPAEKRDPGVTWWYVSFHFFFLKSSDSHLDHLVDSSTSWKDKINLFFLPRSGYQHSSRDGDGPVWNDRLVNIHQGSRDRSRNGTSCIRKWFNNTRSQSQLDWVSFCFLMLSSVLVLLCCHSQ